MATAAEADFGALMPKVATLLFGLPAHENEAEMRWGTHGSLKVDVEAGRFDDYEAKESGGTLKLIMRELRCDKAGALDWLEREGLIQPREDDDGDTSGRPDDTGGPIGSTFYNYQDERGATRYRVERRERGGARLPFRQWGPDGKGGFWTGKGCMKGVEALPYRLPNILMTDDPAEVVYICEGEKDVDRLTLADRLATTNSGGAGKWRPELNRWFEGRRCAILEDNDPAGRKHAEIVREQLQRVAAEVAIVRLPSLPEKGDVSDWLDAGNTVAGLDRAAEGALEAQRSTTGLPLPVELFADIRPRLTGRALIKGLLMAGAAIVVFGFPGCGKSFLVLDWLLHIAASLPWFGRRVEKGAVLYIAAEGQGGVRKRVDAWRREHGLEGHDIPFAMIPTSVDLFDPAAGDIEKLRTVLAFYKQLWGRLDMVGIDTLSATMGAGDENGPDMGVYVGNVKRLCEPVAAGWLIVTHVPLNGDAKRPRGHGSLWGTSDTAFHISGDRDAPARRVHCIKQKDDDPGPDIMFTLKQVEVGTDEHGDAVTSCIVEPSDLEPTAVRGGRRLSAKERITLAALERTLVASDTIPPVEIPDSVCNRVSVGKVASMSEWRDQAMPTLSTPDTKPDTARRAFDRCKENLQAYKIIGVWEDWAWLV